MNTLENTSMAKEDNWQYTEMLNNQKSEIKSAQTKFNRNKAVVSEIVIDTDRYLTDLQI